MAKGRAARIHAARGVGRVVPVPPAAEVVATRYIESSALAAALLEHDEPARASLRAGGRRVTSALTLAEATRAIIRARVTGRMNLSEERAAVRALQVFARRCDIVAVTDAILTRVGRLFPIEPIQRSMRRTWQPQSYSTMRRNW